MYIATVVVGGTTYYFNGKPIVSDYNGILDIVDFIPDTNMKQNELTIKIPEGQEIDWQESAKQEKIIFKRKDTKPRSWEEYCENHKGSYYFISSYECGKVTGLTYPSDELIKLTPEKSKHTLPSKELAEAFLAMMQLMSLRQAWIGNWKPDWNNVNSRKYCIIDKYEDDLEICGLSCLRYPLSFPTKEMAEDFMNTFKNLLDVAKPLV